MLFGAFLSFQICFPDDELNSFWSEMDFFRYQKDLMNAQYI